MSDRVAFEPSLDALSLWSDVISSLSSHLNDGDAENDVESVGEHKAQDKVCVEGHLVHVPWLRDEGFGLRV